MKAIDTHAMWYQRSRTNADDRYGWDDRQLMNFYKAWLNHADAPTTLLRRTLAEADMIASEPVILNDDDLICGQPDVSELSKEEREEFEFYRTNYINYVPQVLGRTGHMGLKYELLLEKGIEGILALIEDYRSKLDESNVLEFVEKNEFYDCCVSHLQALLTLANRYAAEARRRGLNDLAILIEKVPRKPAETFHEALQSMHFYSFVLRDLFSCGRPDRYLIDYYRKDLREGRLTEESALELIDCWNLQYTFYTRPTAAISYILGGYAPDGTPVCNELTWLFMQSIDHVRLAYPCVGLGYIKNINEDLLTYACSLLAKGRTHPGAFAFMMHEDMGKVCMATPDGRFAGEAFNGGSDPVSGRDIKGPTASLLSTTEWDQRPFLGGVAVNLRLNMSNMTEDKMIAVKALIKTFMARNGFELQINTVSPELLEKAMENPEKYEDLLVRIGGYSDYFVRQTPQMQRELIARSYHEL